MFHKEIKFLTDLLRFHIISASNKDTDGTNMAHIDDWDIYSDIHKDAYGVRPGRITYEQWCSASDDGRDEMFRWIEEAAQASYQCELDQQNYCINEFLRLKEKYRALGVAEDRVLPAIRDAYGTHGPADDEHLEFLLGIPFGYITGTKPGMLKS